MTARVRTRRASLAAVDTRPEVDEAPPAAMVKISERVFAGPPPSVPDIYWLAEEGFGSLVSLRTANEPGERLPPGAEARQAQAAGLAYCDIPIREAGPGDVEAAQILLRFIEIFPGPVYVHCASAERAITLARLAERRAVPAEPRQGEIHALIRRLSADNEPGEGSR